MKIEKNISLIRNSIPNQVKLVAISKMKSDEEIMEAYRAGHRIFGENKVQELVRKYESLPTDIEWHMVGHLQSNKVKYIAPFVHVIHAVDSIKLLRTINKEAGKNNRRINCLLQVHIATEETKFGFQREDIIELIKSCELHDMKSVRITGLMGMATYTNDDDVIRGEFRSLKSLFDEIKKSYFSDDQSFYELSMGMSGDYSLAIEEGSTMVRIGSLIFGERNYRE